MARQPTITPELQYIRDVFAPEDDLLKEICSALDRLGLSFMHIGPDEGKLLATLLSLIQAKRVVEIGTLGGYSTLWIARALPEKGQVFTLEKDANMASFARNIFAKSDCAERITLIEGDAHETLLSLDIVADAIFIDADKAGYPFYLDWAEKHVRKGGLIIGDNTFLHGEVFLEEPKKQSASKHQAMREFNQRLADSSKYQSILIPTSEGMTIAIKKF